MQSFPAMEATFLLPGPSGELETLAAPIEISSRQITAVICHPHPLFGGTMNNKVVTTLARAFHDIGLRTVRFNFRGVGKSTGKYDEGHGEVEDLLAVIAWVKKVCPEDAVWLAGFSFGGAIAAKAAAQIPVAQLVTIAPAVPRFGLLELPQVACPWLIVQGEQDDVVLPQDVYAWADSREPQPKVVKIPDAGHFFHGKLMELRRILEAELI